MAHKGAYVTNLNEFINSSYQRYHHRKYIQQLQDLLKLHQRNRRCLPDPAQSIHSKQAKKPLPTSPCFQNQSQIQLQNTNRLTNCPVSPGVSPGRSILLSSPRSCRSRSSSRVALNGSALSNFNSITCFSTSTRTPTPKPLIKKKIPTVIVTSEGSQQLCFQFDNTFDNTFESINKMPPSSAVHPANRNTTHTNHVTSNANSTAPTSNNVAMTTTNQLSSNPHHLRKMVTFKLDPPSSTNNDALHQRTRSAPPLHRSISESSLINCVSI